ncbi:hypothetical protein HG530_004258 [Fusarium avenaceum]|nr:hypothetical protein HG530_004258 [Fusarium avenaceum]
MPTLFVKILVSKLVLLLPKSAQNAAKEILVTRRSGLLVSLFFGVVEVDVSAREARETTTTLSLSTNGCHQQEGTAVADHTGLALVRNHSAVHSPAVGCGLVVAVLHHSPVAVRILVAAGLNGNTN